MSVRNLTKVPKLTLVYFAVDQTTCVVETKKLRMKESEKPFETKPARNTAVTVKSGGSLLDAMVIAVDGKCTCPFANVLLKLIFCPFPFIYLFIHFNDVFFLF